MKLSYANPPVRSLSASSIAKLMTCPEQYRLRYIKRIPESRGPEKFIGTLDHGTLEYTLRYKMRNKHDLELDLIPGVVGDIWSKNIKEEGEPSWYDQNPGEILDKSVLMASMYHQEITPTINPVGVEERFEEIISGVPVPVVGYPDVIERGRIIEKKTAKMKVSKPTPQWLLQGRLYQLTYGIPVEWHVTSKAKTPGIFTPQNEEGLRLEQSSPDGTALIVRQAWQLLYDLWRRYGPDQSWPLHGASHPWACSTCLAGPKNSGKCIVWGGEGYD